MTAAKVTGKPTKFKCPKCGCTHERIVLCYLKSKVKLCEDCLMENRRKRYMND